jgi:hypothetical protein
MACNPVIEKDFAALGDIIRDEYRQRRAKKLMPIWPAVMKIFPFPEFRLKLVNFLLNFALDFEMKIH